MLSRNYIEKIVSKYKNQIIEINDKVWEYAEEGFKEVLSSKLLCNRLSENGFIVDQGIAGMPTAFKASFGSGKPVIALLAEYDALPLLSQESGKVVQRAIAKNGFGHGCGHNSLGAGVFGAALAIKDYLKESKISGTILLLGCPSEEKGNGKTIMCREGIFKDVDAAFTWHPGDMNNIWGIRSLANLSVYFDFKGKTAHAAAAPHLGRSALDAAELMNVGVNYLREHIIPEARVHYAYIDVGGQAPNVVQDTSRVHYFIRAPRVDQVLEIYERIKDIAKGAALMTGTESFYEIYSGVSDFIPNKILSKEIYDSMIEVGPPMFEEEDFDIARDFFYNAFPENVIEFNKASILNTYGKEKGEEILKTPLNKDIAPFFMADYAMSGSTDVGDVSHVVPTAQFQIATSSIKTPLHTWQYTAQGKTSLAHKGVLTAASILAMTSIKVIENSSILALAKEEFTETTEGKYSCPIPQEIGPRLEG